MAPNGHDRRHLPHEMHFSLSICSLPSASLVIAPTGQESSQGTGTLIMALYGQLFRQMPQLIHISGLICARLASVKEMAPLGQFTWQGRAMQPRQKFVTTCCCFMQAAQALVITDSLLGRSFSLAKASCPYSFSYLAESFSSSGEKPITARAICLTMLLSISRLA